MARRARPVPIRPSRWPPSRRRWRRRRWRPRPSRCATVPRPAGRSRDPAGGGGRRRRASSAGRSCWTWRRPGRRSGSPRRVRPGRRRCRRRRGSASRPPGGWPSVAMSPPEADEDAAAVHGVERRLGREVGGEALAGRAEVQLDAGWHPDGAGCRVEADVLPAEAQDQGARMAGAGSGPASSPPVRPSSAGRSKSPIVAEQAQRPADRRVDGAGGRGAPPGARSRGRVPSRGLTGGPARRRRPAPTAHCPTEAAIRRVDVDEHRDNRRRASPSRPGSVTRRWTAVPSARHVTPAGTVVVAMS